MRPEAFAPPSMQSKAGGRGPSVRFEKPGEEALYLEGQGS